VKLIEVSKLWGTITWNKITLLQNHPLLCFVSFIEYADQTGIGFFCFEFLIPALYLC
jgi:hypothetical protein